MSNGSPMQRFLLDALSDGVSAIHATESSLPLECAGIEGSSAGRSLSTVADSTHGHGGME
ncbi:MAG: hypothetical protein RL318_1543 [Fibrobacterota bacterium]|jgi:hypothetical protein